MGAWDVGTFDNDTASDWAYELHGSEDLGLVESAIEAVLITASDYLDADEACEALAACEVLARLRGRWGDRTPHTEAVDGWVEAHPMSPPEDLLARAVEAIDRILAEASELRELWDESDEGDKWRATVAELRARLA
ncbi:MAG: DUF4259 domain-containing protein [Polyangiaceae bacterium]|nr:DUF4259 domain-containing protein [Polyangiaceae bacterium]